MKNINSNPNTFQHERRVQDKEFLPQEKRAFLAFSRQPKTMLMVANEKDIYRANICRYVAKWRKENLIQEYKKGLCIVSLNRAGFFTTNPELFKTSKR